jgi:hypothetical protein
LETINTINSQKPKEVWDYSKENIKILKQNNIDALYVPLESPKWYINKLQKWRNIKYDIGFSGTLSPRRNYILNAVEKAGKSVRRITSFGETRDKELASCRFILNIHYAEDYRIFESNRCEPWLKLGVPVISETSLDDDPRCITCNYDSLIETILNYLDTDNNGN